MKDLGEKINSYPLMVQVFIFAVFIIIFIASLSMGFGYLIDGKPAWGMFQFFFSKEFVIVTVVTLGPDLVKYFLNKHKKSHKK